jgi:hypothetical protein
MHSYHKIGGVVFVELSADKLKQVGWDEQLLIEYMLEEEHELGTECNKLQNVLNI